PAWEPQGKALLAYWNGKKKAKIGIKMDGGEEIFMPAKIYFRSPEESPELEKIALELCEGRILDVGAGAGAHALLLEELEFKVTALDIDPNSVEIMKKRGLADVVCADFLDYKSKIKYDTLLFLMNGIGVAGNLKGLKDYLNHAQSITSRSGQIILDSSDLRISNPDLENDNDYFGEVNYQLSYEEIIGSKYQWLYVDEEKLEEIATECGWNTEIIYEVEDGSYLARLTKI
ncbi:MAG: class I SAM-dependent methyltransferase, partial [Bacteroidetes bacterium]